MGPPAGPWSCAPASVSINTSGHNVRAPWLQALPSVQPPARVPELEFLFFFFSSHWYLSCVQRSAGERDLTFFTRLVQWPKVVSTS